MEGASINSDLYEEVCPSLLFSCDYFRFRCRFSDYFYRKGVDPDFSEALIVRSNSSIEDVCDQVHRTLKETFKYALVWGASARHVPQRVGLGHLVADEDVVSIVAK